MKRTIIILSVLIICFGHYAFAMQPSIMGGIRGGLALGLAADQAINKNFNLRYGAELNTSKEGLILFAENKFLIRKLENRYPFYFGLGLVGYFGKDSSAGVSLSAIIERAFNIPELFFEGGVDVVSGGGKIQLQAGYKI